MTRRASRTISALDVPFHSALVPSPFFCCSILDLSPDGAASIFCHMFEHQPDVRETSSCLAVRFCAANIVKVSCIAIKPRRPATALNPFTAIGEEAKIANSTNHDTISNMFLLAKYAPHLLLHANTQYTTTHSSSKQNSSKTCSRFVLHGKNIQFSRDEKTLTPQ